MRDTEDKSKSLGQIFTPQHISENILDVCDYEGEAIIGRNVIDNSCGDGAILSVAVRRYVKACNETGMGEKEISDSLKDHVFGIEIDNEAHAKCIENITNAAMDYGISVDCWPNVINGDTISLRNCYRKKFDYVIGNPPYVRTHNLSENIEDIRTMDMCSDGMVDLYIVFFDIGIGMLKEGGTLCYITPSSWLSSVAGANLRTRIMRKKDLVSIVDLGHYQPFDNATTYTAITTIRNGHYSKTFSYYRYDETKRKPEFVEELQYSDVCINNSFCIATKPELQRLYEIKSCLCPQYVSVKNGFATLADSVFIGDGIPKESSMLMDVVKASTGTWTKCIFPYDITGKPFSEKKMKEDASTWSYLCENKGQLEASDKKDQPWFLFGRTQAVNDVGKNKIAVNTIIRDADSVKVNFSPSGTGVYGGLYILTSVDFETIRKLLQSDDFVRYVASMKKYKSGGHYTFSSPDLEQYLNAKLSGQC